MSNFDVTKARNDFPLLSRKTEGQFPVYLDSAATSLKPWPVIERISQFYSFETANVHRGAHFLSNQATEAFELAREKVRSFINARSTQEIIFTKGTTDSVNLAAHILGSFWFDEGDEILLTELEHHSNIVAWYLLAKKLRLKIQVLPISDDGQIDLEAADALITKRTKLLAITHCSNALGNYPPVAELIKKVQAVGGLSFVDGAQWAGVKPTDVQKLEADFYAFSAHKTFGPFGIGILYGRKDLLENRPPYQGGGSMIHEVSFDKITFMDLPHRFEAGTPNISGVLGFSAAIDYMNKFDWAQVAAYEENLRRKTIEGLSEIPGIQIYGPGKDQSAGPIVSFGLDRCHPSDIGQILSQQKVAVRAGHHCTQPLMKRLGIPATVRASFSIYNNEADAQSLVRATKKAQEMLT